MSREVSLMVTCLADIFFPETAAATVLLLRRLGVSLHFPAQQTCCGQPHFNSGYADYALDLAKHSIRAFAGERLVVTPSGSCAAMVKLEYPKLFDGDAEWQSQAKDLAERTHELADFIANVLHLEDVGARFPGHATYHMACHLRSLGGRPDAERLLQHVRELELVPLERFDECCGFGGSFSVRFPEISGAMVTDKANFIEKSGADVVIATDAGCLMNIGGCLRRRGSKVRTMHLAEVLAAT